MPIHDQILLTGATGALGPALAADLANAHAARRIAIMMRAPTPAQLSTKFQDWLKAVQPLLADPQLAQRFHAVQGDIGHETLGLHASQAQSLQEHTDIVIHAAADTNFSAPHERQRAINVDGTQRLLNFSAHCPNLRRFLLVSSVFVSGSRTGAISETALQEAPGFVTYYQRTKWEAEQLAIASRLPVGIARISLVMGSHATGRIHRQGAVHSLIKWFARGLVPLVPGLPDARGDVIATETAARCLTRAVLAPDHESGWGHTGPAAPIWHIAAAEHAPRMTELMDFVYHHFAQRPAWRRRQVPRPQIIAQDQFNAFISTFETAGKTLAAEALRSINRFLPDLCFPKTYQTTRAQALWGGPLPQYDWRQTLERVIQFCCPANP